MFEGKKDTYKTGFLFLMRQNEGERGKTGDTRGQHRGIGKGVHGQTERQTGRQRDG